MKKRVAIFQFWQVGHHFETALEIALDRANSGNTIELFFGGPDLRFVEHSQAVRLSKKFRSQTPVNRAKSLVASMYDQQNLFINDMWLRSCDLDTKTLELLDNLTTEKLLELKIGSFELGVSVLSSLTNILRTDPTLIPYHRLRSQIQEIVTSGIEIFSSARDHLKAGKYDEVIVFNGRFVSDAAVTAAAEELGIPVLFHERGCSKDKYSLRRIRPHDFNLLKIEAEKHWEESTLPDVEKKGISDQWFNSRIDNGEGGDFVSFSSHFDRSKQLRLLNELGLKVGQYIVFATTSDDEFAFVHSSIRREFGWANQFSLCESVALLARESGKTLVVRLHPNLTTKCPTLRRKWSDVLGKFPEVIVIDPESNVDSYALVKHCDRMISVGSTLGLESLFLNQKVISCAESIYSSIPGCSLATNEFDLKKALNAGCSVEICRDSVAKIGFFLASFGESFKFFRPESNFGGSFCGADLFGERFVSNKAPAESFATKNLEAARVA